MSTTPAPPITPVQRLADLGHVLPTPAAGAYSYDPVLVRGDLAHVSGQIPRRDGDIAFTGPVRTDAEAARGREAAELCALNALAQIERAVGLDRVAQLLKLQVYVASGPDFADQPAVAEGASRLLRAALGEAGRHARTAIGVPRLPKNATVEIDLELALHPAAH
ncbi:RidA family protein [Leucobacter chromiiresistens]|uniref:Enamine deaminase RidA, house cleaning of reactive enamine intermediates, YjgF/YER057c/UK114 family n=1 Tax=Leucobacter chromiiresistens TaxID=1079994 RepID=A0A1H0XW31_9MICO|nr:RidA family protein [Leucobacter chromiiresistens]SDQ07011.1 Enamine deaminase RidA, house cleaning of reactive enamine intermediates, YjgF/YER057c/UK114 family [Leucobacter chromiiresistens]